MRSFACAVVLTASTSAYAASYTLTPLTVEGGQNVAAAAVNDHDVITGSYVTQAEPYGAGFVGKPGAFVTLPRLNSGPGLLPNDWIPAPTSINNAGAVIGTYMAGSAYVFVWKNDRYVASLGQSVDIPPGGLFPFIATNDHLSYDQYEGHGDYVPTAGTLKSQGTLQVGGFPLIASTNGSGQIAGQFGTSVGSTQTIAAFAGTLGQIQPLLPPDASSSNGGWINDAGQVAGAYRSPHALRGFVYTSGTYRTFGLPTAPVALAVQGIDSHGRVVGAYSDASAQYGFVYAHGHVTQLGSFSTSDTVHVGISASGRLIVLSDFASSTQTSQSFTIACDGTGC